MLRTSELDYDLPAHLIATHPVEPRDACRLMVVSRTNPSVMEHRMSDAAAGFEALLEGELKRLRAHLGESRAAALADQLASIS